MNLYLQLKENDYFDTSWLHTLTLNSTCVALHANQPRSRFVDGCSDNTDQSREGRVGTKSAVKQEAHRSSSMTQRQNV